MGAAIFALASIYVPDRQLKTASQITCLALLFFAWTTSVLHRPSARRFRSVPIKTTVGSAAIFLALVGFTVSSLIALGSGNLGIKDLAVMVLQAFIPLFILFPRNMAAEALRSFLLCSIPFAIADAFTNVLSLVGLADIGRYGRQLGDVAEVVYPGLSGNTHAAGLVAFAAFVGLLNNIKLTSPKRRLLYITMLILISISIHFIGARRYEAMAISALLLFLTANYIQKFNPLIITTSIASVLLLATFYAPDDDYGNTKRAALLTNGFQEIPEHIFLGTGAAYVDLKEIDSDLESLIDLSVTESLLLDFVRTYGLASTLLFLGSVTFTLAFQCRGNRYKDPAGIMLPLLAAELFFGGILSGFPGTILFYGVLGTCFWHSRAPSQKVY
jgi:hypothetical protein